MLSVFATHKEFQSAQLRSYGCILKGIVPKHCKQNNMILTMTYVHFPSPLSVRVPIH